MKQFLHRKATLSKVLLVIRHTAHSTGQPGLASSSKNVPSSAAIGLWSTSRADGQSVSDFSQLATTGHCLKISRAKPDLPTHTASRAENI